MMWTAVPPRSPLCCFIASSFPSFSGVVARTYAVYSPKRIAATPRSRLKFISSLPIESHLELPERLLGSRPQFRTEACGQLLAQECLRFVGLATVVQGQCGPEKQVLCASTT